MFTRFVIRSMMALTLGLAPMLAHSTNLKIPYVNRADIRVVVDGKLDEPLWQKIPYHGELLVSYPDSGEPGRYQTQVRYFHTQYGLYIGMRAEQPPETLLPRLSSRDTFLRRDGFRVAIDSSGEGLYGYLFSVNLGGSISDGVILPENDFRLDWDGAWYGNAVATDNGWTGEMLIPWSILNMPHVDTPERTIGIDVRRSLGALNETWSNPYRPSGSNRYLSVFNKVDVKNFAPKQQYSLFPYSSTGIDNIRHTTETRAGLDVFWRPSTSLQLSAALNPDFGQVEADNVVLNLTAFETFFPEKRLFFLENQEVFSTISRKSSSGTLLNTRRIGANIGSRQGAPDTIDEVDFDTFDTQRSVDLIGSGKVTGQVGSIRYGVLAASEADTDVRGDDENFSLSGRDFGIVRLKYEDSSDGGRRSLGWLATVTDHPNRSAFTQGIDGYLLSADGRLVLDGQLLMSDIEGERGFGYRASAQLAPKNGHNHRFEIDYFDAQLNLNDIGFLPRTEHIALYYSFKHRENNLPGLKRRQTNIKFQTQQNLDNKTTGGGLKIEREWRYDDNSKTDIEITYHPSHWDDRNSLDNGDFTRKSAWEAGLTWRSDEAKHWSFSVTTSLREESESGYKRSLQAGVEYRPSDRYSIALQTGYTNRDAWLIYSGEQNFTTVKAEEWRPKLIVDTFFSAKQQLRIQMEWVGIKAHDRNYWQTPIGGGDLLSVARPADDETEGFAISNLTFQARYRWEIAPLSDLFVVYTRGGSLADADIDDGFGSLFSHALSDPANENLIVKLRYRFGPG